MCPSLHSTTEPSGSGRDAVSFVVPAFNEERGLSSTTASISSVALRELEDYEIIIVDDASSDETGAIAERLAKNDPHLVVIHNQQNLNLGGAFKRGLEAARFEYVIRLNGNNEIPPASLRRILQLRGQADIVIPHDPNDFGVCVRDAGGARRPVLRRILSRSFTALLNVLSRNDLRYYNGHVLHRTEFLRSLEIETDSYGFEAEILIKLLAVGHTYIEVGVPFLKKSRPSRLLAPRNILGVLQFLVAMTHRLGFRRGLVDSSSTLDTR